MSSLFYCCKSIFPFACCIAEDETVDFNAPVLKKTNSAATNNVKKKSLPKGFKDNSFREPLLRARIARENSRGELERLETLASPSQWRRLRKCHISGFSHLTHDSKDSIDELLQDSEDAKSAEKKPTVSSDTEITLFNRNNAGNLVNGQLDVCQNVAKYDHLSDIETTSDADAILTTRSLKSLERLEKLKNKRLKQDLKSKSESEIASADEADDDQSQSGNEATVNATKASRNSFSSRKSRRSAKEENAEIYNGRLRKQQSSDLSNFEGSTQDTQLKQPVHDNDSPEKLQKLTFNPTAEVIQENNIEIVPLGKVNTTLSQTSKANAKDNSDSSSGSIKFFPAKNIPNPTIILTHLINDKYKGKTFAHLFTLGDQIGFGSTSNVYKCKRKRDSFQNQRDFDGRTYAVKVIDKHKLAQMSPKKFNHLLLQFKQEIEILDQLRHPHIIRLHGMFETEKFLHVVTEYCAGGELFEYLVKEKNGKLNEEETAKLIAQVLSAVAYMHSKGIIHRDIKLENIMLSKRIKKCKSHDEMKSSKAENGERTEENVLNEQAQHWFVRNWKGFFKPHSRPQALSADVENPAAKEYFETDDISLKIIDFGLAKATGCVVSKYNSEGNNGRAQTFFGTLGYLAPEMFLQKTYNHSVDVWAVGILMYLMLFGSFPFEDTPNKMKNTNGPINARNRKQRLKEFYRLRYPQKINVSVEAKDLLSKLLHFEPKERIQAEDALEHPWLVKFGPTRNQIPTNDDEPQA